MATLRLPAQAEEGRAIEPGRLAGFRAVVWALDAEGNRGDRITLPFKPDATISVDIEAPQAEVELVDVQGRPVADTLKIDLTRVVDSELRLNELGKGLLNRSELVPQRLRRVGRLSVINDPNFRFESFVMRVAAVDQATAAKVQEALDVTGSSDGWIAPGPTNLSSVNNLQLERADLSFSGVFQFDVPLPSDPLGWVYVVDGPYQVAGFVAEKDTILQRKREHLTLFVPIPEPEIDENGAADAGSGELSATGIPLNATEVEIIERADLFADDPGPFCKPFRNPERVLGERRFQTVLRVEQPEIGASRDLRLNDNVIRDFDIEPGQPISGGGLGRFLGGGNAGDFRRSIRNFSRSSISKVLKEALFRRKAKGRTPPGHPTLIDWEGDLFPNQAVTVAGGHILEWRVRWRSNGYSLGNVNHSLTLAPRQSKRIIKIDYERREAARRQELTTVDDEVTQSTDYSRDYLNAVQSSLAEWSSGSSSSHTLGTAVGIGATIAPSVVIGGGAAHGSAWTTGEQEGERTAAATEEQNLRDAVRQHAEALRQLESTVVTETAQAETVEGVSEVIANRNYCHALTIVHYDVLRHLRVDTELGGVSECLFVPFNIAPFGIKDEKGGYFNVDRVIRHRNVLEKVLLDRRLKWVFKHLEDYRDNFQESSVPEGRRMDQPLVSLRGTLDVELFVNSPLKGDEDARAMEDAADENLSRNERRSLVGKIIGVALAPFTYGLSLGLAGASALLASKTAEEREALFQREIAGRMARRFVNRFRIRLPGGRALNADFTLSTSYRPNRRHKVHFQVTPEELERRGVSRAEIENLTIRPSNDESFSLPNYSLANVHGASIQFATEFYRRSASDKGFVDDLIVSADPGEERALSGAANLSFPASSWEKQNLRATIRRDVEKLVNHLDAHAFHYHKQIWWRMDRDELYTILDGYTLSQTDSRSLASLVEYRPLAVVGNALVFKVARGAFVGVNGMKSLEEVRNFYETKQRDADPMRISLPTGGVYAQALMDECNACEEHFGNTDWVLDEDDIQPQELDQGLLSSRRAEPTDLTPTELPETLISLQNAPAAPAPSGLQGALDAVTKGDSFRDLAQVAGTQQNARAALEAAKALASEFGNLSAKQMDAERAARERLENSDLPPEQKKAVADKFTPKPGRTASEECEDIIDKPGVTEVTVEKPSPRPQEKPQKTVVKKTPKPRPEPAPALDGELLITMGLPDDHSHMRINLLDILERAFPNQSNDVKDLWRELRKITQQVLGNDAVKAGIAAKVMKKFKKLIPGGQALLIVEALASDSAFNAFESVLSAVYDTLYYLLFPNVGFIDQPDGKPVLSRHAVRITKLPREDWVIDTLDDAHTRYNRLTYNIFGTETTPGDESWGVKKLDGEIRVLTLPPIDNDGTDNGRPEQTASAEVSSSEYRFASKGDVKFNVDIARVIDHYEDAIAGVVAENLNEWSRDLEGYLKSLKSEDLRELLGWLKTIATFTPIGVAAVLVDQAVSAVEALFDDDDDEGPSTLDALTSRFIDEAIEVAMEKIDWIGTIVGDALETLAQKIYEPGLGFTAGKMELNAKYAVEVRLVQQDKAKPFWEARAAGESTLFPQLKVQFLPDGADEGQTILATQPDDQGLLNLISATPQVVQVAKRKRLDL